MKKFKPVILISIISAIIFSVVSFWVSEVDWPFLPYLILAGCFVVWVQPEKATHKFLSKLLVGSLFFGFLIMTFIFLRMYIMSHLVYRSPLPFSFLWDKDTLMIAAVYSLVSFLGGLLGIVLKGFYTLYKNKLNKIIIFIGPIILILASLAISSVKISCTIMSKIYGWPYPFLTHQVKDVIDGSLIDKWIFLPGALYIIFDYLFYLIVFLSAFLLIKFADKKINNMQINATFVLFGLLVFITISMTSFLSIKQSYISHQITKAGYCKSDLDCVIAGNKCPFSCAIVVNKNEADRIMKLVNFFDSTCVYDCGGNEKAFCFQNKCQISFGR